MEERENKEKRRENEQTAISTASQATDTPIKNRPTHSTGYRRLDSIPNKETIKKQSQTRGGGG